MTSLTPVNSSLVHEVHDNFDFEHKIFDIDTKDQISKSNSINYSSNIVSLSSSASATSSIQTKSSNATIEKRNGHVKNAPSTSVPNFFSTNFDENGYVFDGIKIDIEDIDNTSVSNITTQSLKRCKMQVLAHYYNLLIFIGWRSFYKEHYYRTPWFFKIINFFYPLLIVSLLIYAYVYDVMTCQGKLNIYYDTQYVEPSKVGPAFTRNPPTTKTTNKTSLLESFNVHKKTQQEQFYETTMSTLTTDNLHVRENENACGHIVTTYIIPSLLHLIAYILGFIYFRINENEQLYALMEKVFLAVNQTLKMVSQDRVIKRIKIFMILGLIWVILSVGIYLLSKLVFDLERPFFEPIWASILIEIIALVTVNLVYLAVVINHATQCEMIILYVNEIRTRLEEKSITLKEAMQQILDIRMALGNLNSTVSKMATIVALNFVEKFIIGIIIIIINKNSNAWVWVYRILFTLSWFLILTFTLAQIARLNSVCSKFKQIALASRVYGYHNSNRDELDSFLLFIANAKLRAKLFGVPLKPSVILATVITITFTMIILFQSSVISTPDSYI